MLICNVKTFLCLCRFNLPTSRAFSLTRCCFANHYELLKVAPDSTAKEIRDAYIQQSKANHPDLNPNDPGCHDRFVKLQEAYKILSNSDTRRQYDATLGRRNYTYASQQRPFRYHGDMRPGGNTQDFNQEEWRYYTRPQRMSPDEMAKYLRFKRMTNDPRYFYGFILSIFVLLLFQTLTSRKKEQDRYLQDMYRNVDIFTDANIPMYQQRMMELEAERRKRYEMELIEKHNAGLKQRAEFQKNIRDMEKKQEEDRIRKMND